MDVYDHIGSQNSDRILVYTGRATGLIDERSEYRIYRLRTVKSILAWMLTYQPGIANYAQNVGPNLWSTAEQIV